MEELTIIEKTPAALVKMPINEVMTLAEVLAKSGYFKDARDASQCVVKILAGQEVGIPAIASMKGVYIIEGKPTFAAATIGAMVKRSGKYNYKVLARTNERCELEFQEWANGKFVSMGTIEFTAEDAARAQLVVKDIWKKYPANMLFARAMTGGVNLYCPDIFMGPVYTPEELGAPVTEEGDIIIEEPKSAPQPERAQRTTAQPRAAQEPKPEQKDSETAAPSEISVLRKHWIDQTKERNKKLTERGQQAVKVDESYLAEVLHMGEEVINKVLFDADGKLTPAKLDRTQMLRLIYATYQGEALPKDAPVAELMAEAARRILAGEPAARRATAMPISSAPDDLEKDPFAEDVDEAA